MPSSRAPRSLQAPLSARKVSLKRPKRSWPALAGRLRDRLLELPLGVGAFDPRGDPAGAVEREHPRLAAELEGRHLRPDAAVDPVVPEDLHVDELDVVAALGLH